MNQDLVLAHREDIKGRFGTKGKLSQVWNEECGLGRSQVAKISSAVPETKTE